MTKTFHRGEKRDADKGVLESGAVVIFLFLSVLGASGVGCNGEVEPRGPVPAETSGTNDADESSDVLPNVLESSEATSETPETPEIVESSESSRSEPVEEVREAPQGLRVEIERCVDGDTLIVRYAGKRERVRLIGVNTPETVKANWPVEPFGPEASAYTKKRVEETGKVATLVSDGDEFDKYDRRLAFVYLGDETISLNEDLARQGLGKVELQYNYSQKMKDRLQKLACLAESEKLGIYGENAVVANAAPTAEIRSSVQGERVRIERVLNGDTLIAQGGERVQLIGIDAPEREEPGAAEATAYVQRRLAAVGGVATLVSDGDPYDNYGRRLAFVYPGSDTISLNEDLVRQGLAEPRLRFNYSQEMKNRLQNAAIRR